MIMGNPKDEMFERVDSETAARLEKIFSKEGCSIR